MTKQHFKKPSKERKSKFPSIFRRISEYFNSLSAHSVIIITVVLFLYIGILIVLVLNIIDLQKVLDQSKALFKEREQIKKEITYWETVVKTHKDYRDGYFQLALLDYRLKHFDKAFEYVQKALQIDPNFEPGRRLEKVLSSKY